MQREFIITRQGRDYVVYAGLLDAAHRDGLAAIRTTLIQAPTPANGFTAICQAEVTTSRGTFASLGDADPENAPRPMTNTLVRLAETRAKARALADAINVAMPVIEEHADVPSETAPIAAPLRSPARRPIPLPVATEMSDEVHPGPLRGEASLPDALRVEDGVTGVPEPVAPPRTDIAARRPTTRPPTAQEPLRADAPDVRGSTPPPGRPTRARAVTMASAGSPATGAQLDAIARLARALGRVVTADRLTRTAASELITQLSAERYPSAARREAEAD
jgi:hypothetical protein